MGALLILLSGESRSQTNTFVAEGTIGAIPPDLEVTPNGAVAVVRGSNGGSVSQGGDNRLSFWRTSDGARMLPPLQQQNTVGRGDLSMDWTANKPMFEPSRCAAL